MSRRFCIIFRFSNGLNIPPLFYCSTIDVAVHRGLAFASFDPPTWIIHRFSDVYAYARQQPKKKSRKFRVFVIDLMRFQATLVKFGRHSWSYWAIVTWIPYELLFIHYKQSITNAAWSIVWPQDTTEKPNCWHFTASLDGTLLLCSIAYCCFARWHNGVLLSIERNWNILSLPKKKSTQLVDGRTGKKWLYMAKYYEQ